MIQVNNIYNGDCLELMPTLESGSFDLILVDPPYGTMNTDGGRKMNIDGWDNVLNYEKMFNECSRLLRRNGKLLMFCQEPFTSTTINKQIASLPFSYKLFWLKDSFANALGCKKAPVNYVEEILVFSTFNNKHDFEGVHPLREYFKLVLEYTNLTLKAINNKLGHRRAEHSFYINSSQFSLCTQLTYNELIKVFSIDKMQGFKPYEELKKIDTEFRTKLKDELNKKYPSVFNLPPNAKYKSNVLEYKKDYNGYHPTQKPVALLEDLIKTYSNVGDNVLDFTCGSGSTGVACQNTDRNYTLIEKEEKYYDIAKQRLHDNAKRLKEQLF